MAVLTSASGTPATAAAAPPPAAPRAWLDAARGARTAGRYATAESLATLARDALSTGARSDTLALAEAWYGIAESRCRRFMVADTVAYDAARRSLALTIAAGAENDSAAADAHQVLGEILGLQRRSAEGVVQLQHAVTIRERRLPAGHPLTWLALFRLGQLLNQNNQPDTALVVLARGIATARASAYPRDRRFGDLYTETGTAWEMKGDPLRAIAAFDSAIVAQTALGPDNPGTAYALGRAAVFRYRRGEIAQGIEYQQRAIRMLEARVPADDPELLNQQSNLAKAYLLGGDPALARDLLARIVPLQEKRLGSGSTVVLTNRIALANTQQMLGDSLGSLATYAAIRAVFEGDTTRSDRDRYATVLFNEGELRSHLGETAVAIELAGRAERMIQASATLDRRLLVRTLVLQMSLHAERGEWAAADSAAARLDRALATGPRRDPSLDAMAAMFRSDVEYRRGRRDHAVAFGLTAAQLDRQGLEENVAAMSDEQALHFSNEQGQSLDQILAVAAFAGGDTSSLAWNELVHRRGLVRAVIARRRPPAVADSAGARLHETWASAERALAQFEVHAAGAPPDSALAAQRLALSLAAREAERRLVAHFPDSHTEGRPEAVGFDTVLAALRPGEALIAFAQIPGRDGPSHLGAFVARGRHPGSICVDVGEWDSLSAEVARWRAMLCQPDPARRQSASWQRAGARLRERLWSPVAAATRGDSTVFLVPEGFLQGFPWAALPGPDGRFLVENGPALHVLDAERDLVTPPSAFGVGSLLAIGGIDYGATRNTRTPRAATRTAVLPSLAPLPGAAAEAEAAGRIWRARGGPATVLEGARALEDSFKTLAPGRTVIHLATHGLTLADMRSVPAAGTRGIGGMSAVSSATAAPKTAPAPAPDADLQEGDVLLAFAHANAAHTGAADSNEGLLTSEEVETLDLRGTEWVVLSACHSASGRIWVSQGVVGMQRAFRLAGARTVIASQWSVDDQATREWMEALYRARAAGATRAGDAMRAASREVLAARRKSGRSTHPFEWAAFTATGE